MGSLIEFIIAHTSLGEKAARAAAYISVALIALGIIGTAKCTYDHAVVAKHEAKLEQRAKPATDAAAQERANDAIRTTDSEKEKHDVIHSVPDAPSAGPGHALACKRLHDLGRNTAACR